MIGWPHIMVMNNIWRNLIGGYHKMPRNLDTHAIMDAFSADELFFGVGKLKKVKYGLLIT
jgi:hypothetical protein